MFRFMLPFCGKLSFQVLDIVVGIVLYHRLRRPVFCGSRVGRRWLGTRTEDRRKGDEESDAQVHNGLCILLEYPRDPRCSFLARARFEVAGYRSVPSFSDPSSISLIPSAKVHALFPKLYIPRVHYLGDDVGAVLKLV